MCYIDSKVSRFEISKPERASQSGQDREQPLNLPVKSSRAEDDLASGGRFPLAMVQKKGCSGSPLASPCDCWKLLAVKIVTVAFLLIQMEFDEKDLRREISYAIKNIHGVRQVSEWHGRGSCSP